MEKSDPKFLFKIEMPVIEFLTAYKALDLAASILLRDARGIESILEAPAPTRFVDMDDEAASRYLEATDFDAFNRRGMYSMLKIMSLALACLLKLRISIIQNGKCSLHELSKWKLNFCVGWKFFVRISTKVETQLARPHSTCRLESSARNSPSCIFKNLN